MKKWMIRFLKQSLVLAIIMILLPTMSSKEAQALPVTEYLNPVDEMSQIVDIVTNSGSVFVIDDNQVLWSWGFSGSGQLGDGTTTNQSTPVKVLENVNSVSVTGLNNYESVYALKTDGSLWSWGNNDSGQLGDGTITNRSIPFKVLENVKSLTLDRRSAFAIKDDGSLWSWGYNSCGQLGDGSNKSRFSPVKVLENVSSVQTNESSTFAIKTDGSLWSWGDNRYGQLGDGKTIYDRNTPVKVLENVVSVLPNNYSNGYSTYSIQTDGSLWSWGSNAYGELGDGSTTNRSTPVKVLENVKSVMSNGFLSNSRYTSDKASAYAILNDGSLWSWGNNDSGQLGDGTNTINRSTPMKVLENVSSVTTTGSSKFAIQTDGSLWSWGYNRYGQLGDGTTNNRSAPVKVLENVSSVQTSNFSTFAVKTDGSLWSWGYNQYGQLGDGTTTYQLSTPVKVLENVNKVISVNYSTIAVKIDGSLWVWGENTIGQLGERHSPVQIVDSLGYVGSCFCPSKLYFNSSTAYAILNDGSLWSWGRNNIGQLGDGTYMDRSSPFKIMDNVFDLSVFDSSIFAVKTDGSLWSWGSNSYGELGDGTTINRSTPVKVLDNVTSVVPSYFSTFAVKTDGSLWSWGYNGNGQLGDGTTNQRLVPVKVLENITSVVASDNSTFAVKTDGSLWSWGYNGYGQLGVETTRNQLSTPTKVLENVIDFVSNYDSFFAIKNDRSLWSWGRNNYGKLGDGTTANRSIPIKVLENVNSIRTGDSPYAIQTDGSLWSWGRNEYGQLGDGTTTYRSSPFKLLDSVSSITTSNYSTYAIQTNGSLWAWGKNDFGQIGDATDINRSEPIKVLENVISIKIGNSIFATKTDGSLWSWGANSNGELGDGTIINRNTPFKVLDNVKSIESNYSTFAIKNDGSLWFWGSNNYNQSAGKSHSYFYAKEPLKITNDVKNVFLVNSSVYAIKNDGSLWSWGYNNSGQLGNGVTSSSSRPAKLVRSQYTRYQPNNIIYSIPLNNNNLTIDSTTIGHLKLESVPSNYDGTVKFHLIQESKPGAFLLNESGSFVTKESSSVDILITNSSGELQYHYINLKVVLPILYKGFFDGGNYNSDVQVFFKNALNSKVNGQSLSNGQIFRGEGQYSVELTDYNAQIKKISFTIDRTPPVFTVLPYDITPTNQSVRITVRTDDGQLLSHTFENNGSHEFVAYDKAGNRGTHIVTINHIDKEPPLIQGVSHEKSYNKPVTITFEEGTATLNGESIQSGTEVSEEGVYKIVSMDSLGNTRTINFIIDKTAPSITIQAYNQLLTNQSVSVVASTNEGTLNKYVHTFELNGSFTFIATDKAGNVSEKTVTITNIDKVAPVVEGVTNNELTNQPLTITFNEGTATLNGEAFESGSTVNNDGSYQLIVTDLAGNQTVVNFRLVIIESISVTKQPTKLHYLSKEPLDLRGGQLSVHYQSGKVETVDLTATIITNNTLSDTDYGPKSITVSYLGFSTTLTVYLNRFSDVPYGYDFYHTIMDITNRGIANGYQDGRFGVDDNITRAEAAVMLVNAVKLPFSGMKASFTDVPATHWASAHIAAAVKSGILNGYGNGKYGPEDYITRAELAVMVANTFKISANSQNLKIFKDVPTGFWAGNHIQALASNGIVGGYSTGYFGVDDFATRAQFTKFISFTLKLQKK